MLKITTLTGSLVVNRRHEFAHQHVEATITGEHYDLSATIKRLNSIGLAECSAAGRIVERAHNSLAAALPDPIAGPKRVQSRVQDKHRILLCEIADCSCYSLRMNFVLAPAQIGLLVQHAIPLGALVLHSIEECRIILRLQLRQQQFERRPDGADDCIRGSCSST
ncbi:hypothetical protein ACVIIV_004542 [Bradyrhizobium sp. USDA 4354]